MDPTKPNIFSNGFQLYIYVSFAQISDFIGMDMCEKLVQACESKALNNAVNITVRAKGFTGSGLLKITEETFNRVFIESNVSPNCSKVYICGPPSMNERIPIALKNIGVTDEKIILV